MSEDNHCTQFAGVRGTHQACEYTHFLLHGNDRLCVATNRSEKVRRLHIAYCNTHFSHQRHTLEKFLKGELKCTPVQIADSIALLIKHDVTKPNSEKWIGTYSREQDTAYFIGNGGKRVMDLQDCLLGMNEK
ncbi:hypothetical protein Y032_0530g3009 [Ancylostoma ceylanicum]|uniref:Uncharacterized protein n=1 Tax=Ancylostoma ceylanicum TaxID=53326 RepID=A0A016WSC0_9BILA|nr:hypothetical protein Y032_0530g3009 [Ancylostoma ceylanicum]